MRNLRFCCIVIVALLVLFIVGAPHHIALADGDLTDSTLKAAKWALVPAESADAYQKLTVTAIAAGQIVRQVTYPQAFAIGYKESYDDVTGVGEFTLVARQKKDHLDQIQVEGGFAS